MEKLFTGRDGYMQVGNDRLLKVTAFNIQGDLNLLETTALSENVKTYAPGHQSFSGTTTVIYYKGPNNGSNPAVDTLMRRILRTGSTGITREDRVELRFFFDYPGAPREISFRAYITSVSVGASVGEVVSSQISFTCDGPLETVTL
jgi:hypothetical protein